MTRKDYDTEHLIRLLQGLKSRYPHMRIILEPGSAFTWQTGVLTSEVVDIVESRGIKTAITERQLYLPSARRLESLYNLQCAERKWEMRGLMFTVSAVIPV